MSPQLASRWTKYVGKVVCSVGLGALFGLGCGGTPPADPGSSDGAVSVGGLRAQYFSDTTLTNLKTVQVDPTIDFDWGTAGLAPTSFSVRWSGMLTPGRTENYTFYTQSDDGVRLWIDGTQLVDDWTPHGVKEDMGTVALTANKTVYVRMEYYQTSGNAVAKLFWSSPSTRKQIVPQSALQHQASQGKRFAGDPGVGKFYVGANDPEASAGMPVSNFERQVLAPRRASLVRVYNPNSGPSSTFGFNRSKTSAVVASGKIPLTSFVEGPYTIAQIANGAADRDIQDNIAYLRSLAPAAVWVSYHHEPEDEFVTSDDQASFRAASRRFNLAIKAARLPNVTVVGPIYMGATARDRSRDWRVWNPDWNGTRWVAQSYDLEGWDVYDPPVGSAIRKQYTALMQPFIDMILRDRPGDFRPFVIGELGVKAMNSLPDPDYLPLVGRPHTDTLGEFFQDMEANVDKSTGGIPTQMVGVCFFNAGAETAILRPFSSDRLPAETVRLINRMNPGGWPDGSFYPVDDPGELKKTALNRYLMSSPKRVDF